MVIQSSPEPTTPPKTPLSAGKRKNRLPAPKASPGLYFPPAPSPSDLQVDVNNLASVTSNVSSSSSASFRLPLSVLKELAQDIEEFGGFQKFLTEQAEDRHTIRALCEKKTHIYGKRDDPLRDRIR
jgi:ADP-heptose:LPS heptosyltransferase